MNQQLSILKKLNTRLCNNQSSLWKVPRRCFIKTIFGFNSFSSNSLLCICSGVLEVADFWIKCPSYCATNMHFLCIGNGKNRKMTIGNSWSTGVIFFFKKWVSLFISYLLLSKFTCFRISRLTMEASLCSGNAPQIFLLVKIFTKCFCECFCSGMYHCKHACTKYRLKNQSEGLSGLNSGH